MGWDLTELPSLDDLHLPRGAIKKAQELAAALFKAEETFFLVNGVTGGLLALFLAVCRPGEKVLLTRISHKAALHGLILSGAKPVFLPVEKDSLTGFPLNVSPETVAKALQEHPDARLLLITSPSYWGVAADLMAIKKIINGSGVIFAVDEAHGAHFPFYGKKRLPHSARAGADIWLQSAHKSLGALTPGAFLHLGRKDLAPGIRFWLQVLQTSSPPYPVMISLDLIRRQLYLRGRSLFAHSWKWAQRFRRELENRGFEIFNSGSRSGFLQDPCRITILCPRGEGLYLAGRLAQKYHLQLEMQTRQYLLAIAGPAQLSLSAAYLARAFKKALEDYREAEGGAAAFNPSDTSPDIFPPSFFSPDVNGALKNPGEDFSASFALPPREALYAPSLAVPLEKALREICAEIIVLSPPGIPLLSPGEVIIEEMINYLLRLRAEKVLFQGAADPFLRTIKVVKGKGKI